jgi:hypothetical protein
LVSIIIMKINFIIIKINIPKVRSLVFGERQLADYHQVLWNAMNELDQLVFVGIYIYMIQEGEFRQTNKMVPMK